MTSKLRLESLEDRWNLSPLEPFALVAPTPEPEAASTTGLVNFHSTPGDHSDQSGGTALPAVGSYALVIDPRPAARAGGDQQDYFTITLSDVLVSSYAVGGINPGLVAPPAGPEPAQVDYFLRLKGIDGEAISAADDVWVDGKIITGQNFDSARSDARVVTSEENTRAGGGGGGAGKVQMQDIHFVAKASKASPIMLLAVADGEHVKLDPQGGYAESSDGAGLRIPVKVKHNV